MDSQTRKLYELYHRSACYRAALMWIRRAIEELKGLRSASQHVNALKKLEKDFEKVIVESEREIQRVEKT